MLKINLR